MKKIGTLLLLGALFAVSCGKNSETKEKQIQLFHNNHKKMEKWI